MICLGGDWLAAATDRRIVRIFSITGIQLQLFTIAGPVVSMAASDDKLMVVHHTGLGQCQYHLQSPGWLGSRVVSVLDSGIEGPGFKSQSRRCRVTVLGKLFTPIVPLFTKHQNCQQPS